MLTTLGIIFFVFGTIIGSFLNVVIFRYNTHRTLGGHSGCIVCQKKLNWYELFPIFSFLFLKGRCKGCKTKISFQYPIVEFFTGLFFLLLFLKFQNLFFLNTFHFSIVYAYCATIFSLLMVIAVYDLKHKIIPDTLALFLGGVAFLGLFFFNHFGFYLHFPTILELLSGLLIALPFFLLWLVSKGNWMGFGDVKLAIGLGWFLGISKGFSAIVLSFWIGAIVGIFLMIFSKKYGMKSEIPFGPFLVLGSVLAFLFNLSLFSLFSFGF